MMTRMERATATWALALPRRRAIRWYRSPRKVVVRAAALAAWLREPRSQVSPWPFFPARARVPDWRADGHSPAQDTRWAAVGNLVMSRPVSAMMERARSGLRPGISASRATAFSTGASGLVPAPGPVVPSGSTPQPAGSAAVTPGDPAVQPADPGVQGSDLVQQQLGELAVVVIEHAIQGLDESIVLGLHGAAGQQSQRAGIAFPRDHGPDHVLRGQRGQLAGHGRQLDQRAFQQLFQPLPAAGPLADKLGPGPGVITQVPDRLRRDEPGPEQAHLGQPGQPHRIELVGLGPAGQVLGLGRLDQLDLQPARLQDVEPDTPVVARRLERDDLDAVLAQLAAQYPDRVCPGLNCPHGRPP